jgi:hypothetical protein
MSEFDKWAGKELPPMPGCEMPKKTSEGIPFVIYINGKPLELAKKEALGVMAQIINILMYIDESEREQQEKNNG